MKVSAYLKKIILYGSDDIEDKRVRPIENLIDRVLLLQEDTFE